MNSYTLTGADYHQTIADVDTIKQLVAILPPNPVLINIGACFGTSSMAMLEERPDAYIFSIDISECHWEKHNLQQAGLWQLNRVHRILNYSQDVGKHWPYKVDFVYVDGGHDYQAVVDDIAAWRPHVSPNGIMLFHDYDKPICPEVKPAVDAMMLGYEMILQRDSMIAFRIP